MNKKNFKTKIFNFIFPTYDELALFLYSIVFLLFLVFNLKSLWESFLLTLSQDTTKEILLSMLVIIIVFGIIALPIYHAFSKRVKKKHETRLMLFVVVVVDFIVGINVYEYLKTEITDWEIIFPIFNAVHSSIILIGWRYEIVNSSMISDEHAKLRDVIISGILVIGLFWFYQDILEKNWAITFSVCIFYATMINKGVFYLYKTLKNWLGKKQ
jgi:membrane-associated HD superfamily phosphohydrolase